MAFPRVSQPVDARGQLISRAMGLPVLRDVVTLVSATTFVDIYDLAKFHPTRAFTSLAIRNPSASSTIELSFGEDFASTRHLVCGTQEFFVLDNLMFGPLVIDESTGLHTNKIRARLGTAQGTAATGTISYVANPADGMKCTVDGKVLEFSNDASKQPTSDYLVVIAATADLTWANFAATVTANIQSVQAVQAPGVVTITSVAGGALANAIAIADVSTGATFSGATLLGATGGVRPVFHIW